MTSEAMRAGGRSAGDVILDMVQDAMMEVCGEADEAIVRFKLKGVAFKMVVTLDNEPTHD